MDELDRKNVRILLVEDDDNLGALLKDEIECMGCTARHVNSAEDALVALAEDAPDIVVSDLRLPGMNGLELLQKVIADNPELHPDFVIITAFGSVSKAVESLHMGAEDFLTKPIDLDHFKITLERIYERRAMRSEIREMKSLVQSDSMYHGMVGRSQAMINLFQQIKQVAKAESPVLVSGESGTGKELVARAVHAEGCPENSPFVAVNCAGIPNDLLESEFFGHESGAFTGAGKSRQGLFEEAEGGTLLLDEISEMPMALQAKLLRVLQDGRIRPVGGNRERQVNVRIIAATNRELESLVEEGCFREDLFYRLETFQLKLPPLRAREGDIDLLAGMLLNKYSAIAGKRIKGFSRRAMELLHLYDFPGNVREMQNSIERAVVFCPDSDIRPEHFPQRMQDSYRELGENQVRQLFSAVGAVGEALPKLEDMERMYIRYVLDRVDGNKKLAAEKLGIARRTLYRRLGDLSADENN